jgi:FkbM family methyltransferase
MNLSETAAFIKLKDKINVVFDVGVREDSDYLRLKPTCEFHLFEPNKTFCENLKSSVAQYFNVKINQYGISDEILDNQTYYENTESFIEHPLVQSTHNGSTYNLRTIDWYVKENKIDTIDFLKIDAEGMDYKILLGAKETIARGGIRFIQFEYWDGSKKFYDLLSNQYNLYFVRGEDTFSLLTPEVISEIDDQRIPNRHGGDIVALLKTEEQF